MSAALVRCAACGTVNRLSPDKLSSPRCGKCEQPLQVPDAPVPANGAAFDGAVIGWPGPVLVEFWSPT